MRGRNRTILVRLAVVFALIVFAVMGYVLARNIYIRKGNNEVLKDVEPVGDETSDKFVWKGSYMDTMFLETTLDIDSGLNGVYKVTLTWGQSDSDELAIWNCTATYDREHKALVYQDATRTNLTVPGDGEPQVSEVYSNGTGFFFVRDNKVYWEDREEDFGSGMQFEKN